jgi:uncharacterized protein (DUF2141 family)
MKLLKSLIVTVTLVFAGAATAETLTLRVETQSATGTLRAAIFDSQQAFDADIIVANVMGPAVVGVTELRVENLEPGVYGITIFHDLNGNDELDRNLFGAPNEPFGFSNNPKIKFSAPEFDTFKFQFDGQPTEINIALNGG